MTHLTRIVALDWPDTDRPTADRLASRAAREFRRAGYARVRHDHNEVSFGGRAWLGDNWNPLTYVGSGTLQVISAPGGFQLRFRLSLWRLGVAMVWGAVAGTVISLGSSGDARWLPLALLVGIGGVGVGLEVIIGAPAALTRLIAPPADVPWTAG